MKTGLVSLGLLLCLVGCKAKEDSCRVLFGIPGPNTGLSEEECKPSCSCPGHEYAPPTYTETELAALEAAVEVDGPAVPTADPYDTPEQFPEQPSKVCAVLKDASVAHGYRVKTFESAAAAEAAGGEVTHTEACGLCSSLQDLAVYLRKPDLTTPVRECGLVGFREGDDASRACLAQIGFTEACAAIWFFNTRHTRQVCLNECITRLNEPNLLPDGGLNPCIQCDEDQSGPVFKAVAGRTRRNSGVPSGLCRPCDSVSHVTHRYSL